MTKKQLNVRVDATHCRDRPGQGRPGGISMNQYIEKLVQQDMGEVGRSFVDTAAQFMKEYEAAFLAEFGEHEGTGQRR
ncbi:toxin-antitoxin system HicB family antitoxin [Streptacidiphilus sp. 4-A2]|nr:toxin-antitoxin system HicB family antitoxin [Streptacidiphilus sp. 4-A2]